MNATAKGDFVYDSTAAQAMLSAAKQRAGVRYMVDLEHDSLHPERRVYSAPTPATRAAGFRWTSELTVRCGRATSSGPRTGNGV
jgi:hypothetical protein